MIYVKRANVVLEVKEDDAQHYLDLGYNIIDDNGRVIQEAIPKDVGALQKFYVDAKAKIERLEKENAELNEKLKSVKNNAEKSQKQAKTKG